MHSGAAYDLLLSTGPYFSGTFLMMNVFCFDLPLSEKPNFDV